MPPTRELTALLEELSQFRLLYASHHRCTKRQLLSLIGKLAFACKAIPAGRIFLRRLLDTAHSWTALRSKSQSLRTPSKTWSSGSDSHLSGTVWHSFLSQIGHQHMNSSFSRMQQAILAMLHNGTAIGSVNHGLQTSSINQSSGRSCTPLLLHAKYGASTRANYCSQSQDKCPTIFAVCPLIFFLA